MQLSPGEDDFFSFYLLLYLKREKETFNETEGLYVCIDCLLQVHIGLQAKNTNVFSHLKIPQITTEIDC